MSQPTERRPTTRGPHPIGDPAPGWWEQVQTRRAAWAEREREHEEAFYAGGGQCWHCRDTGFLRGDEAEGEPCDRCVRGATVQTRLRTALVNEALQRAGVPRRYLAMSFETLPEKARRRNTSVRRFAESWEWRMGTGVVLLGEPSVGKTGALVSALRRVEERWADETAASDLRTPSALPMRRRVWWTTDVALLDRLRATYDRGNTHAGGGESETAQDIQTRAKECALLIIDDFGKADYKGGAGWAVERLYDLIDARYAALRPTWFSTNLGLDQLAQRLGEPGEAIMERVLDACEAITLTGAKLRMGVMGGVTP